MHDYGANQFVIETESNVKSIFRRLLNSELLLFRRRLLKQNNNNSNDNTQQGGQNVKKKQKEKLNRPMRRPRLDKETKHFAFFTRRSFNLFQEFSYSVSLLISTRIEEMYLGVIHLV